VNAEVTGHLEFRSKHEEEINQNKRRHNKQKMGTREFM
jgi:hypothetical protein